MAETTTLITEYRVSCVPDGAPDADLFAVWVQWRGEDRYCVSRHQNGHPNRVLSRDGRWEWEPSPSERSEEFSAETRFSRDEALALAERATTEVKVGGFTASEWAARRANRLDEDPR